MSTVPPLHRSDGGLGGIGRASEDEEQQQQTNTIPTPYGNNINNNDGIGMRYEEESSLAMAREFLSRLVRVV